MIENPNRDSVLRVLRARRKWGASPRLIADRTGLPYRHVIDYLIDAMARGWVVKPRRGVYVYKRDGLGAPLHGAVRR